MQTTPSQGGVETQDECFNVDRGVDRPPLTRQQARQTHNTRAFIAATYTRVLRTPRNG